MKTLFRVAMSSRRQPGKKEATVSKGGHFEVALIIGPC